MLEWEEQEKIQKILLQLENYFKMDSSSANLVVTPHTQPISSCCCCVFVATSYQRKPDTNKPTVYIIEL